MGNYSTRSLKIKEEIGDKSGIVQSLLNIGLVYQKKGEYDKALDYYSRSLKIFEELGDKMGMGYSLINIGIVCLKKAVYDKAAEHLEKSIAIQMEIENKEEELETTTYLYLTYKKLEREYDVKEIHKLIKETEHIDFELNYGLYELLEDTTYLETAYRQIQENAGALEDGKKFLGYPIPKAIVQSWEKLQ